MFPPATPRAGHGRPTRPPLGTSSPRPVFPEEIIIPMTEMLSAPTASQDVELSRASQSPPDRTDLALAASLRRAAAFIRTGSRDRAESELLTCLETYSEEELSTVYIGAIALVRDLDLAPLFPGPVLPLEETDTIVAPPTHRRSSQRRDYAHAIATALRVRMNPQTPLIETDAA